MRRYDSIRRIFYLSMHSALFGEAFDELGLESGAMAFCHHENMLH